MSTLHDGGKGFAADAIRLPCPLPGDASGPIGGHDEPWASGQRKRYLASLESPCDAGDSRG